MRLQTICFDFTKSYVIGTRYTSWKYHFLYWYMSRFKQRHSGISYNFFLVYFVHKGAFSFVGVNAFSEVPQQHLTQNVHDMIYSFLTKRQSLKNVNSISQSVQSSNVIKILSDQKSSSLFLSMFRDSALKTLTRRLFQSLAILRKNTFILTNKNRFILLRVYWKSCIYPSS